jgi:hypothetical protein
VKFGGLGLPDPTRTADAAYATSCAATTHLCEAIRGVRPLQLQAHQAVMWQARADHKALKAKVCEAEQAVVVAKLPEEQQQAVQRAVMHKMWRRLRR